MLRNLGMGVSSSLIAAAIAYWFTEHHFIPALVIGGAGVVGFLLTWFFAKKPEAVSAAPFSVNQENKQEFAPHTEINPQFNISVGNSSASAAAPEPAPEKKNEPRCNIHCKGVKWGVNPANTYPFIKSTFAAAVFENEALPDSADLRIPTVKARAVFRNPDGLEILDLTDVAWIPGNGKKHETLQVNTPKYLLLFTLVKGKLRGRSVQLVDARIRGRGRKVAAYQDYDISLRVGSVEIQLLTEREVLYRVLLTLDDQGNGLPSLTESREL